METKKNVRKWNIEDIFGFKVSGFAEIAAMGACLKFLNNEVPDIDMVKKRRSSKEEVKGTISLWKITLGILAILFLWCLYVQFSSLNTYRSFQRKNIKRENSIEEFKDLSASQIRERVATMRENAADLSALITQPRYTNKLTALPDLMPDEMYYRNVQISYPMASKAGKSKNSINISGVIHSLDGSKVELNEGNKFYTKVGTAGGLADLCRNNITWDYPPNDRTLTLGTFFTMKCERE